MTREVLPCGWGGRDRCRIVGEVVGEDEYFRHVCDRQPDHDGPHSCGVLMPTDPDSPRRRCAYQWH